MASLFDHLVGAGEQRRRHVEMRTEPICFSLYLYRARNLVERFFNKIKPCRRIATRYDKLAANYLAFVQLTSIRLWLRVNEFLDVMRPFRQECPI
jgi:transposase